MSRIVFGPGLRGAIAERIQRSLADRGFDPKGIDGWYGKDTAEALRAFQAAEGVAVTGEVDELTWARLVGSQIPTPAERSVALTAILEGHGYEFALGDWDGAGLTWGIIGFTWRHGEVQKILLEIEATDSALLDGAFGDLATEIRRVLALDPAEQMRWARGISLPTGRLSHPWELAFRELGRREPVRGIQLRRAHEDYLAPAVKTAKLLGLRSELGLALCFDIHVQNGGVKPDVRRSVGTCPRGAEPAFRLRLGDAVADAARQKYRADVRARKRTIASGAGTVHGLTLVLGRWGLGEYEAAELV